MSDDESGLHDGGELNVAVSLMLTLELVQQGLIGSLREAAVTPPTKKKKKSHQQQQTNEDKVAS